MKHTYTLVVRGYELDSFGHVNNAVYLQYAEAAIWDFLSSHGLLDTVKNLGLFPVILENNIRYMHEFKLMDKVRIETEWTCTEYVLMYKHIFYNDATNLKSCRITGKLMLSDKDRVLCDIPESVYRYIQEDKA